MKVLINGAAGKMGQIAVQAITTDQKLKLVGVAERGDNLRQKIIDSKAEIVIDFTTAAVVFEQSQIIINSGARPIIGTSGLSREQITALEKMCAEKKLGGIIVPNFSIGAVLMMRYAQEAARYFPNAEIIEMHHNQKQDAPSGTAMKTAELIANARNAPIHPLSEKELLPGARGATLQQVPIHSVRLAGLLAHQIVVFGNQGELLTIRHDTTHREAFIAGIQLACHKVVDLKNLIYGLEHLI